MTVAACWWRLRLALLWNTGRREVAATECVPYRDLKNIVYLEQ